MKIPEDAPRPQTPMERLAAFTKKLIAVPKSEIDQRARKYDARKKKRKKK